MPYGGQDIEDFNLVCETFKLTTKTYFDITESVDTLHKMLYYTGDKTSKGNIMARVRMIVLYHYARLHDLLVIGTSNKSEYMTGYFTKWGDGSADFYPLIGTYKTEVWELSKALEVPEKIIYKEPSAGFYEGQTDERELGIDYEALDYILPYLTGLHHLQEAYYMRVSLESEYGKEAIERVKALLDGSEHKRKPAVRFPW